MCATVNPNKSHYKLHDNLLRTFSNLTRCIFHCECCWPRISYNMLLLFHSLCFFFLEQSIPTLASDCIASIDGLLYIWTEHTHFSIVSFNVSLQRWIFCKREKNSNSVLICQMYFLSYNQKCLNYLQIHYSSFAS